MRARRSEILFKVGRFWVRRASSPVKEFEVYHIGATYSTRVARIGYVGNDDSDGLRRAIAEAERRAAGNPP